MNSVDARVVVISLAATKASGDWYNALFSGWLNSVLASVLDLVKV